MSNEELEQLGQMKVKQLKNRYNDPAINRSFIVGVDRAKMRLYDVEQSQQNLMKEDDDMSIPFDNSRAGENLKKIQFS